jgi:hypothetical protein
MASVPLVLRAPAYINWYINGYGRPWTSSNPNPTMRPDHGQIAGSCGVLPVTTDHMASRHVPLADQYPRRGAGRKGAYRCRHAMAPALRFLPWNPGCHPSW